MRGHGSVVAGASIQEVVLLTGYCAEMVQDALGATYRGMRLRYSTEDIPLGTAGAVRQALPYLEAPVVLLLNGDSYCDVDLGAFCRFHFREVRLCRCLARCLRRRWSLTPSGDRG